MRDDLDSSILKTIVISKEKGFDLSQNLRIPLGMQFGNDYKPIGEPKSTVDLKELKKKLDKLLQNDFETEEKGDVIGL